MPYEPTQPPIWDPPLTGRDRALVAGYILHYREMILSALEFGALADPTLLPEWLNPTMDYYQRAEEVTRWLLWWTGYRVARDQMWDPGG